MSKVRICDRCGKHLVGRDGLRLFPKGYKYFTLDGESHYCFAERDLCPPCMEKFNEFMKGDPDESNKSE